MTKTEANRFRGILTAKVAELERFTRQRDGIVVERSADQLESRRRHNVHLRSVTSTENSTSFGTLARPFAVPKNAASAYASGVMKTSTRNGLPRRRGRRFVCGARKP
jgi:hypothetical protein